MAAKKCHISGCHIGLLTVISGGIVPVGGMEPANSELYPYRFGGQDGSILLARWRWGRPNRRLRNPDGFPMAGRQALSFWATGRMNRRALYC